MQCKVSTINHIICFMGDIIFVCLLDSVATHLKKSGKIFLKKESGDFMKNCQSQGKMKLC